MPKLKIKNAVATIAETFEGFLNSRKASGLAEKTIQAYRYHFSALGKHLDTGIAIDELRRADIEAAIAALRDSGLSANSIHSYVVTVRVFLAWCRAEGLTDVDVKPYKGEETVKDTYCVAQAIANHFDALDTIYADYRRDTQQLKFYMERQWNFVGRTANTFSEMII